MDLADQITIDVPSQKDLDGQFEQEILTYISQFHQLNSFGNVFVLENLLTLESSKDPRKNDENLNKSSN